MSGRLLFGGSFDPIHHGHLIAARAAAEQLSLDAVVLIPSAIPPHRTPKDLAPAADRLEMCRRAVAGDPLFEVDDWELRQAGPSYTLHTVRAFRKRRPGPRPHWLIGQDTLGDLQWWHRVEELVEECHIVTAARPGFQQPDLSGLAARISAERLEEIRAHILETPQLQISSRELRSRRQRRLSIRYFTPDAVIEIIEAKGLYGGAAAGQ